jgi:PAS domain S-box-containing protein
MTKRADNGDESARDRLIGLGRRSISKSYYPELRRRVEELELFRSLLDQIQDAIFIVDVASGMVLDVAGATQERFGCDAEQLKGRPFADLLPDYVGRYVREMFGSESGVVRMETKLCCPGCSETVPVDLSIQIPEGQHPLRAVVVARDISDRKRAEEALRTINQELERRVLQRTRELDKANQAKSEFLSVVSHELRTPLTSIIGFAKIMRKRLDRTILPALAENHEEMVPMLKKMEDNLDVMVSEGDRLGGLINDLLDVAKLETGHMEYHTSRVEVRDLLERSGQAVSGLFEDAGIELNITVEQGLPWLEGDRDRLMQVVINLLSNAAKYADGKPIELSAGMSDNMVRVSVRDHGPGVPQHLRRAIFRKFVTDTGEEAAKAKVKGTGLGLAICRHIVEAHGGRIGVRDPEDGGSEFSFTLPPAGTD